MNAAGQPFGALTPSAVDPSARGASMPERLGTNVLLLLAAIWLCGTTAVLLAWYLRWRRVQKKLRWAVPATTSRELAILRRINGGIGVSLRLSQNSVEPGIFGVFRPVLIWPEKLSAQLEDAHIETILAHELMHLRRRDNLSAALHMVVEAVFWFHPMTWWIERRLMEERERACDEAVVQMGNNAETYAESLLKASRFCVESPLVCASGVSGADLCRRVRSIITLRVERLGLLTKSLVALLMVVSVGGPIVLGACNAQVMAGQASTDDRQKAAGGKMEFEVASVRLNPGPMEPANFRLSPDDAYTNTGGLLIADYPLDTYIEFAYKLLLTREQFQAMYAHVPKWVKIDNYEIRARASSKNPTKDQMRLMMQSLLKKRFGLEVHYETQDTPVLEMKLKKPATLGPQLRRHEDGPACDVRGTWQPGTELKPGDIFPSQCGGIEAVPGPQQTIIMGARDTTMAMMAKSFQIGRLGRPIVDATDLTGSYDFRLTWTPTPGDFGRTPNSAETQAPASDSQGTPFLDAVREQLGLKFKPGKAPLKVLVIDHVERPSGN